MTSFKGACQILQNILYIWLICRYRYTFFETFLHLFNAIIKGVRYFFFCQSSNVGRDRKEVVSGGMDRSVSSEPNLSDWTCAGKELERVHDKRLWIMVSSGASEAGG